MSEEFDYTGDASQPTDYTGGYSARLPGRDYRFYAPDKGDDLGGGSGQPPPRIRPGKSFGGGRIGAAQPVVGGSATDLPVPAGCPRT